MVVRREEHRSQEMQMELVLALVLLLAAVLLCCGVAALWYVNRGPTESAPMAVEALAEGPVDVDQTLAMHRAGEDPHATRPLSPADCYQVPTPRATLIIGTGEQRREERLQPGEDIILGRLGSVMIDDPRAGRTHARITADPTGHDYWIEDLHSLNGTFVNGELIDSPRKLVSGDRIGLGNTVVGFICDGSTHDVGSTQPAPTQASRGRSSDRR
jgi:hypothetical protein